MMVFKKVLSRAVLLCAALLLLFYSVLLVRDWLSYRNAIAYNADVIIKIPVDDLAIDYFFEEFGDLGGGGKKDKKEKLHKGIYYPANVFVYTIKGKKSTTWFTSLPVADSADVANYLIKKYKLKRDTSAKDYGLLQNGDGRVLAGYTDDRLMLSYSKTKESVTDVFESLLVEEKQLTNESYLKILKSMDDDVAVFTEEGLLCTFELEKGFVSFNATLKNAFKVTADTSTSATVQTDTTKAFYLSMDGIPLLKQNTLPLGETGVSVADVLSTYATGIELEMNGTTMQEKSVITYEYNDDFEKVEVKTTTQEEVPSIAMSLKSSNVEGLENYLANNGVVTDSVIATSILPLYTLLAKSISDDTFMISTKVNEDHIPRYSVPFYLYVNFKNLAEYKDFLFLKPYVKDVKDLEMTSHSTDSNTLTITGKLNLSDSNKSPLKLLIK